MIAVWILLGLVAVCLVVLIIAFVFDEEGLGITSFVLMFLFGFAALFTWIGIDNAQTNRYNEQTQQLCDAKHGVLSKKDGLCYVDNKPVEFEPGVWKR